MEILTPTSFASRMISVTDLRASFVFCFGVKCMMVREIARKTALAVYICCFLHFLVGHDDTL